MAEINGSQDFGSQDKLDKNDIRSTKMKANTLPRISSTNSKPQSLSPKDYSYLRKESSKSGEETGDNDGYKSGSEGPISPSISGNTIFFDSRAGDYLLEDLENDNLLKDGVLQQGSINSDWKETYMVSLAAGKKNAEFHSIFRSVPENDRLVDTFSCALQKDILVHGKIFISTQHICFNSNIFGWVTNLVISFSDILTIERKSLALFIPNSIFVTTLHSKYMFTSFMNRELVYTIMIRLWRYSLGDEVTGFPLSRRPESTQNNSTTSEERNTFSDGMHDTESLPGDHRLIGISDSGNLSIDMINKDNFNSVPNKGFSVEKRNLSSKTISAFYEDSAQQIKNKLGNFVRGKPSTTPSEKPKKNAESVKTQSDVETAGYEQDDEGSDFEMVSNAKNTGNTSKPNIHVFHQSATEKRISLNVETLIPVEESKSQPILSSNIQQKENFFGDCCCTDHLKNKLHEYILNVPFKQIVDLLYFGESDQFMIKFFNDRGYLELDYPKWTSENGEYIRTIKYIMLLTFPIGPKSTRCSVIQRCVRKDDNVVCIRQSANTPDVPTGTSFNTLVSFCIINQPSNQTKILVSYEVEFLKPSWIKGSVEKGAADGNSSFYNDLKIALEKHFNQSLPIPAIESPSQEVKVNQEQDVKFTEKSEHVSVGICGRLREIIDTPITLKYVLFGIVLAFVLNLFVSRYYYKTNGSFYITKPSNWWLDTTDYESYNNEKLSKLLMEYVDKYGGDQLLELSEIVRNNIYSSESKINVLHKKLLEKRAEFAIIADQE